jgi:hypothetical protein
MIGFGTSNLDTDNPSYFWRLILRGGYELTMANSGHIVGPEIVVMADQEKAADIADLVKNKIAVYENHKGKWKQRR